MISVKKVKREKFKKVKKSKKKFKKCKRAKRGTRAKGYVLPTPQPTRKPTRLTKLTRQI